MSHRDSCPSRCVLVRAAVEDVFAVKPAPKRQNAVRSVAKS